MKLDQLQPGEVTFTIERSGNQHSSCQRRKVPQLVPGLLKGKESQGKESQVLETNSQINSSYYNKFTHSSYTGNRKEAAVKSNKLYGTSTS